MGEVTGSRGDVSFIVSTIGATLRSMVLAGHERLATPATVEPGLGHHGAVLAPWPGRTAGGRYEFNGVTRHLAITDPATGHAIHGLVTAREWELAHRSDHLVTLSTKLDHEVGYPFHIGLSLTYATDGDELICKAAWVNLGSTDAPFGLGFHPYFATTVDDAELHVPAAVVLESDPLSRLPRASRATTRDEDFLALSRVGSRTFSRSYGHLQRDQDGTATVSARLSNGHLRMRMSAGFRWVQVFTGDLPASTLSRKGVALEPLTCPPNALVSGTDLLRLTPGQQGEAWWSVSYAASQ